MNWIFVFIAGLSPIPASTPSLDYDADAPTVIARYTSEQKCREGYDAFKKSLRQQTLAYASSGNYLCLPVGEGK